MPFHVMHRGEIGGEQCPVSLQNRDCSRPLGKKSRLRFAAAASADTDRHHQRLVPVRMGGSWCYKRLDLTTMILFD